VLNDAKDTNAGVSAEVQGLQIIFFSYSSTPPFHFKTRGRVFFQPAG